jgi:hypothetical protein
VNTSEEKKCIGFSFTIRENGKEREAQLMGSGGLLGSGLIATVNHMGGDFAERACKTLMHIATYKLHRVGWLLEWKEEERAPFQRIVQITPEEIVAVNPIYDEEA